MDTNDTERKGFSGKLGYVLSAAGASVGLGNIWRFPYLAAKYGGGIFLLVYILLALTFGYTMIVTETAIGRASGKSPVGAFRTFSTSGASRFGGWINAVIPMLIVPYYSVIGGWVCKYLFEYIRSDASVMASDTFFGGFITDGIATEFWFLVFALLVLLVILMGVENGIERVSRVMMPVLVVLAVILASVMLGSKLLLLLALVTGAAAAYLIVRLVRMHRAMNRQDGGSAGER
jgi:NSS family neurotransmitter:Na+ symporter